MPPKDSEPDAPQAPARRAQRLCALALLLLALVGLAATVVVWQADAASRAGQFARALWWRPQVPLYQRQYAESLLLRHPRQAEQHLLRALRLNPYDAWALADLTTVELTLGHWPQALASNRRERGQPGYATLWRLANLYLAHGDAEGFWTEMGRAAARAPAGDFPALVSRALTASNFDFAALRRALPGDSSAAAAAFLAAAVAHGDHAAARTGAGWLLGLPRDAASHAASQQALLTLLVADWRRWPADAAADAQRMARAGWLPRSAASASPAQVRNGGFDPAREAAMDAWAPDPDSALRAILDWRWPHPPGVQAEGVVTGDAAHPSAAELDIDGSEADRLEVAEQWILPAAGSQLALTVWTRALDQAPAVGLSLRLQTLAGAPIAELLLAPTSAWRATPLRWQLPHTLQGACVLSLDYRRPRGTMPLDNRILIAIAPAGGRP